MPSTIIVNNMTTQHKMSIGITSAFPDVCKTPAPPAPSPVPIPYPNIGQSMMATSKVTKRVTDNKQKVVVKGSCYSLSNGDQPGIALGVVSSKIMGKSVIKNQSFNVKFEKKGVGRLKDPHGNNSGSKPNAIAPMEGQSPAVGMSAKEQKAACERLKDNHVPDDPDSRAAAAERCGMLPEHAEGISGACAESGRSISFRSTNKDSANWISQGFPAKGCDIPEKSISDKTIPKLANPDHLDLIQREKLSGLVGAYNSKGELVGVRTTSGWSSFDDVAERGVPGNAYTGDYDAHDMFESNGQRIRDGSAGESDFRRDLNRATSDPGGPRKPGNDMVRHGPQNNYSDYVKNTGKGKPHPIPSLQLPDVSKAEPLLVFDGNGQMYILESEQDLRDYYACKGQKVPEEWDPPKRQEVEQRLNKGKK